jgi:NAD(P)-dependent dehydrogenase (short-subunit alcohol dehydrogenase family)
MMTDFKGKTVLITGASRGLGEAIALDMAAKGAHILACARDSDALTQLGEKLSSRATVWAEDATDDALLHRIESAPRIDILVNNLGTNRPKPIAQVSDDDLDIMLNMNLRAAYRITRAVLKVMPDGGNIINMSSQMGHVGAPNRTVYCMTKHGLEGLTKALAVELAPRKIRVNALAPTFVETPMTKPMFENPEFSAYVNANIPLGQLAQAEDVAAAASYLASDAAIMVTGHSLVIDGGWTAQ